jgi:hypothetical protein
MKKETTGGHLAVSAILITVFEGAIQFFFSGDDVKELRMFLATVAPPLATCIGFFSYRFFVSKSLPEAILEQLSSLARGETDLKKQIKCQYLREQDRESLQVKLLELYAARTKLLTDNHK